MKQNKASRRVIARAHRLSREMAAAAVGPEHLLLGILREEGGVSAQVRRLFHLDPRKVRQEVENLSPPASPPPAKPPLSPAARRAIDGAGGEAARLGAAATSPEHLLLAILAEERGIAVRALVRAGTPAEDVCAAISSIVDLEARLPHGTEGEPPTPEAFGEILESSHLPDQIKGHAPDVAAILPHIAEIWRQFPGGDLSPEQYRTLLEKQIPAITFIVSIEEKKQKVYVSPQIEKILGYTPKEWLKNPTLWYERLHPEDRDRWNREFGESVMSRSASVRSVYRFLHRDGRTVWILGDVRVGWHGGNPLYVQAVGIDVTELKVKEDELAGRARDLEAANRALEEARRERERLEKLLHRADQREIVHWKSEGKAGAPEKLLLGGSERIQAVRRRIIEVAPSDASVLILGETGTGKQLVAEAIHYNSPRAKGPFREINCADYPAQFLEDELFGHERGGYTGAARRRRGQFEQAHGGTLFLDEIGDMPKEMQGRVLKVLDRRPFQRIGGETDVRVDVRVVCATNRDLKAAVENGLFRRDLYRRIKEERIEIAPLRDRRNDIKILAKEFLKLAGRAGLDFSREAMDCLERYGWPENVAELKSATASAARKCDQRGVIRPEHLPEEITGTTGPALPRLRPGKFFEDTRAFEEVLRRFGEGERVLLEDAVKQMKRLMVKEAMERNGGIRRRAAHELGLSDRRLEDEMSRLGL